MRKARIVILGSASGIPVANRFHSSLILETEEYSILFDVGEGASFSLLKRKIDFNRIGSIFVTHCHIDHCGGLPLLIQMMHLVRRQSPLDIYLPQEAVEGVEKFLEIVYLFRQKLSFKINFYPINEDFVFSQRDLKIKAYSNQHLVDNKNIIRTYNLSNKMQSFCFSIALFDKKIIYSGDIGTLDDLTALVFDADLVITECMHVRIEHLLELLKKSQVRSVIFTHIPVELEGKEKEILDKAKEYDFDNLKIACDGMEVALDSLEFRVQS